MIIEKFKDVNIAYMRRVGKYGPENKKLMENFKAYLKKNNLFKNNTTILAIAMDNPTQTPEEKQRYDVGIVIPDGEKKLDLPTRKIINGHYAIFEVKHTTKGISNFWKNIPNLNLPIDNTKPIIERYSFSKVSLHLCEFCIPLR
ncbi:MAG: AraC family transcriptional regulator [Lactobacillaceae bacterium]